MIESAGRKTVVLIGDFCLDVYFHCNSADLEPSLETGLMVRKVNTLRDSLGGAGNVFANLCALGTGSVVPVGVVGDDFFGAEMQRLLSRWLPSSSSIHVQKENWTTYAYMKPILDGKEQERIDTGLGNKISEDTVRDLLETVRESVAKADVVIINQQLEGSIYTDEFIDGLNSIAAANPGKPFIVDARSLQSRFHGMWHKFNTHEAAHEAGIELDPMHSDLPADEIRDIMRRYYEKNSDPLIVSRGEYGAMAFDGRNFYDSEGISLLTELDTVGAGDSFLSGFTLSVAAGLDIGSALNIGNAVSGVTIQKLHQTGTCSPEELKRILANCDYTYNADAKVSSVKEPFSAEVISDFEKIKSRPAVKFAVFDHDGTISTLREGWEEVMEGCMVDAISGGKELSPETAEKIRTYCRAFIAKSTGIQTISQMVMLVDIVKRWGMVPPEKVKTPKEYKAIYNEALMAHITHRLELVRDGLLKPEDTTIAGSIALLHLLSDNGVKCYLASGTDIDDVRNEAELLGYADYFTGGIYGSVGDVNNDPKRQVLRRILREGGVNMDELVIFGDGPVEMREAHDNGALAFGVLSNEVRRYGRNEAKHSRLLHAGADLLVADFLEYKKIASFLLKKQL